MEEFQNFQRIVVAAIVDEQKADILSFFGERLEGIQIEPLGFVKTRHDQSSRHAPP